MTARHLRYPLAANEDWPADLAAREAAWECIDPLGARGAEEFGAWLASRETPICGVSGASPKEEPVYWSLIGLVCFLLLGQLLVALAYAVL